MFSHTIILTTADGRVVSCNDAAVDHGSAASFVPVVTDCWPEAARQGVRAALARAVAGGTVEQLPPMNGHLGDAVTLFAHPLRSVRGAVETVLLMGDAQTVHPSGRSTAPTPETSAPIVEYDHLREMSGVIAHEIRNPLAAVRSAIEQVSRRLPAGGAESSVVEQVLARIDSLDALLDDLLLFSDNPEPQLRPVSLEALLADLLRSLDGKHGPRFHLSTDGEVPLVNADETLLRTALVNLLMNALQSDADPLPIEISLAGDHGEVSIVIEDHGPGFSSAARDALFRPFFTTKARGTGLGLPMARRLVQLHAGKLSIDSSPAGARVVVTLPAVQAQPVKARK